MTERNPSDHEPAPDAGESRVTRGAETAGEAVGKPTQVAAADAAPESTGTAPGEPAGAPGRPAAQESIGEPARVAPGEPAAAPSAARVEPMTEATVTRPSPFGERSETAFEVPRRSLVAQSRRDFLLFAGGVFAAAAGAWWLLPDRTKSRLLPASARERLDTLAARAGFSRERRERTLDRALTFDDDVAEALYSKDRRVRTYARSEAVPLRNNYHGRTPGPEYLPTWSLQIAGLASGRVEHLAIAELLQRFPLHDQVTRLVCVEGWSAVAWWGGLRFADLLAAFPPAPGARWAALRSMVSLDTAGRPEPYYVSIDLETARHPQALLATHHSGQPLTLAHGAPMRLIAPMKLGLKNIKALTDITYTASEPADYWSEQGYSKYDGL